MIPAFSKVSSAAPLLRGLLAGIAALVVWTGVVAGDDDPAPAVVAAEGRAVTGPAAATGHAPAQSTPQSTPQSPIVPDDGDRDSWGLILPAPLQELLELIDQSLEQAGADSTAGVGATTGPAGAVSGPAVPAREQAGLPDDRGPGRGERPGTAGADSVATLADPASAKEDPEAGTQEAGPVASAGAANAATEPEATAAEHAIEDSPASAVADGEAGTREAGGEAADSAGMDMEETSAGQAGPDDEAQAPAGAGGLAGTDPALWGPPLPDPAGNEYGATALALLGAEVAPGKRERLHWTTGQSFSGSVMETPVVVVHGIRRGPRLCLTAGIHGDELNGIEVVRRLAYRIEPEQLAGTVVAVPIVNLLGFSRGSRYLPDRRDLNRFFPGSPYGSSASRIAHSFFTAIVEHCDALVDIHTGSMDRANLPQVRGDLTNPQVLEFTRGFGATAVLHSPGSSGMLRVAAAARGIPAVTFEIGAPMRLQPDQIDHGVQAIETLLNKMGMIEKRRRWREPQAVFYESRWVRVDHGGMLFSDVALGDRVRSGQRLGRVIDPVSNRSAQVYAPEAGRIIGMALNQLVLPGFAAYNLGIAASEEQVVIDAVQDADPDDERYLENDQIDQDRRSREDDDGEDHEPSRHREAGHDD